MKDFSNNGFLTSDHIGELFRLFDSDGSGTIDQTEYLKGIRGGLTADRKALVHQAFKLLNTSGDGRIKRAELEVKYKGVDIQPMMKALGDRNADGVITLEEFEDYCAHFTLPSNLTPASLFYLASHFYS